MMGERLYLCPAGMLWGASAAEAVGAGQALPVAGGPAACLAFELIESEAGSSVRRMVSAQDMAASTEPGIRHVLERITSPRRPIAGLSFKRPVIMGIVNVTPDSFSDGGDFGTLESAIAHARHLASAGADIVDIGGESTRPGSDAIDDAEEMRRILPVIGGLRDLEKAISVDTRKARVMEMAVQAGASMINDVSALTFEPSAAKQAARLGAPVVLMHAQGDPKTMQEQPTYKDVVLEVYDFLEARIRAAEQAGIRREKLIADPGIGFGKTIEHNLALLARIGIFHGLGVPVLLGASRKRFIGTISSESDPKRRGPGSIGVALAAAAQAVQLLRVHDVGETRQALDCWFAVQCGQVGA